MAEIPLKARVECTDGPGGETTTVIVDPTKLIVTHVVVREAKPSYSERIVPAERVVETSADTIRLDCTVEELRGMRQFLDVEFQQVQVPAYYSSEMGMPYYSGIETIPVIHELVPEGGRSIHPGTPVEASDGRVGELSELLTDADTGKITHLVLREGHLWGNRKVLLPIAMVEGTTPEGAIRLHADKKAISALLAIPARQVYGVANVTLLVWTFDQGDSAGVALQTLKDLAQKERTGILAAAQVVKDAEGKASMAEMGGVDKKHGALFGAVAGGLLGLVGGPVGLAVGAAAGAVTGRAASKRIDLGFPDEFLRAAAARLEVGRSAVLALVENASVDKVSAAMAGSDGVLLQMPVTDENLARLAAEV